MKMDHADSRIAPFDLKSTTAVQEDSNLYLEVYRCDLPCPLLAYMELEAGKKAARLAQTTCDHTGTRGCSSRLPANASKHF